MQAFDEKHTQSTMDNFLNFSQRFAKIKSKRLQKAVSAIRGYRNEEILLADVEGEESPAKRKGRKRKADDAPTQGDAVFVFLLCCKSFFGVTHALVMCDSCLAVKQEARHPEYLKAVHQFASTSGKGLTLERYHVKVCDSCNCYVYIYLFTLHTVEKKQRQDH